MRKRQREIEQIVARCGLALRDVVPTGKGHFKAHVQAPAGIVSVVFASTPGDWRGDANNVALLRRVARSAGMGAR